MTFMGASDLSLSCSIHLAIYTNEVMSMDGQSSTAKRLNGYERTVLVIIYKTQLPTWGTIIM